MKVCFCPKQSAHTVFIPGDETLHALSKAVQKSDRKQNIFAVQN
jgi:hypothetical protein